ncbi:hypothetical protein [Salinicoccus halitifaciens]|uniref:Uncharacterized protein n=1 Tax=Salinicoccus halitifaciens TaxID=1073415 RepID=A0ABV2ECG0_9STAP|nr:hypothetical protein [Salinicoccus halitifaciens]MCD2138725.1 hypothetical protein [Salinicoccus halitifaciens]
MQEFFTVKLILTQHLGGKLGMSDDVSLSKVSRYATSINADDNFHVLLGDLGGTLGIDQELRGRRNPAVTAMNYMGYDFAVLNHRDLSNISKLRRAVGFARYPFLNCNIGHPNTKEPFFGEPYEMIDINGMRLAYVSGYAGPFEAEDDDLFEVADIGEALRRTLRYIYDNKDPDYVIVAVSDWDESMQEMIDELEGVGIVVTGASEVYGGAFNPRHDADAASALAASFSAESAEDLAASISPGQFARNIGDRHPEASGTSSSPRLLSGKEVYTAGDSEAISMYHHHHEGFVMSIDLRFKRRTTTFEYLGHTISYLDKEISELTDDIHLNDLIYYHL